MPPTQHSTGDHGKAEEAFAALKAVLMKMADNLAQLAGNNS